MSNPSLPPRLPISRSELGEIFKNPRTALAFEKLLQTISSPSVVFQPGDMKPSAGAGPQEGWLVCDGSAVSRAAYPNLFAAIGTMWGPGDGSLTFNLPPSGVSFIGANGTYPLGSTGGASSSAITLAELPTTIMVQGAGELALDAGATGTTAVPNTAGGHAISTLSPYGAVTWLIKT